MFKLLKPKRTIETSPQILDLLQLTRAESEYKMICVHAIHQIEEWKIAQNKISKFPKKIHGRVEGALLRRKARAAVIFYKMVKDNRIKAFQDYMEKLPQRATAFDNTF